MMKYLPTAMVMGLLRHVLTAAGGGLVVSGQLDTQNLEVAIGGVMALVGVVWSLLAKREGGSEEPASTTSNGQKGFMQVSFLVMFAVGLLVLFAVVVPAFTALMGLTLRM